MPTRLRWAVPCCLAALLTGCPDDSPVLVVESLDPDRAIAGSPGFTLTVRTTDGSLVALSGDVELLFGGVSRPATVVDAHTVTAQIQASEVASPRSVDVILRVDSNADPMDPDFLESPPVAFRVLDVFLIEILPEDTTVEVGDSVGYTARAVLTDTSMIDVTQQMAYGSTELDVAFMNFNVAHAVGPGQSMITGTHQSGATVLPATLNVTGGGGGGQTGTAQILIGPLGDTEASVVCYDVAEDTFGAVVPVNMGSPIQDVTYLSAVDRFFALTQADAQVWRPLDSCGVERVALEPYSNLNEYFEGVALPPSLGAIVGFGNTLLGDQVRFWEVTPTDEINELTSITGLGAGGIQGMGISHDGNSLAIVTRSVGTIRVATSAASPPFSWTVGDEISVGATYASWDTQGDYGNVTATGDTTRAFSVDHANRTLTGLGSALVTSDLFLTRALAPPRNCVFGLPETGNQIPGFSVGGDGSLTAAGTVTVAAAEFMDALAPVGVDLLFTSFEAPGGGEVGVAKVRIAESCAPEPATVQFAMTGRTGLAFGLAARLVE